MSYNLFSQTHDYHFVQLDWLIPTRPGRHFLCLWFKIPILRQELWWPRVVPGHQRASLSGLIPVSYHIFSETHFHFYASARPANLNKTWPSLPVFGLKSQFFVSNWRKPYVVPGHQRTSLSDLLPVSYHLFSETHGHLFAFARPANPNKAWLPFPVFLFKIPILPQVPEGTMCDSGTPKNFDVRLDPGELSSFQWNTLP